MDRKRIIENIVLGTGLGLFAGLLIMMWVTLGQCEQSGGEWDNITVECVPKGKTSWERWFPPKEKSLGEELDKLSLKLDKMVCEQPSRFEDIIEKEKLNCEEIKKS